MNEVGRFERQLSRPKSFFGVARPKHATLMLGPRHARARGHRTIDVYASTMTAWAATSAVREGPTYNPKVSRVLLDACGLVVLAETSLGLDDPPAVAFSEDVVDYLAPFAADVKAQETPAQLEAFVRGLLEQGPWSKLAARHGPNGNAAVIVVGVAHGAWALASVGDARAYRVHNGSAELVVLDHALFTQLVAAGRRTESEFFSDPMHTVVCELLGVNTTITVRTCWGPVAPGERLVLCTQHIWMTHGPAETRERLGRLRGDFDARAVLNALPTELGEATCVVVSFP